MAQFFSLKSVILFICAVLICSNNFSQTTTKSKTETITIKTITFPLKDGLLITADYYKV